MLQFRHERKVDEYQWELWIRPIKNIEREVQQCIILKQKKQCKSIDEYIKATDGDCKKYRYRP